MLGHVKGFLGFISVERGIMLFMITMGSVFLIAKTATLIDAVYLGFVAFVLWSGVDAVNNVYDVDLDIKSDPQRADFTKNLGSLGLYITIALFALCMGMGVITGIQLVPVFVFVGILAGVIYSVPPFRLRQTILKPVVNFSVGAVPILIVAAFFNDFSVQMLTLFILMGTSTAVNSLWEDLADYKSDFNAHARTILVVLGVKRGLYITIAMGYIMIPLMILVGTMFHLSILYFVVLTGLVGFLSVRLIQNHKTLFGSNKTDTEAMLKIGETFAKDFVIIALVHTANLMVNGYLIYQQIILG
jgi:4-hydroxybenzoate polyprenyltransferase